MASGGRQSGRASSSLGGRTAAGGEASRRAFGRLLGVAAAGPPFAVRAVAWVGRKVRVAVTTGADSEVVFTIEARQADAEGLLLTEALAVRYGKRSPPQRLVAAMELAGAAGLAGRDMEALAQLLEADPDLGQPGQPQPSSDDSADRPRSLLDTWGASDAYADFFATGEMARGQLDAIDPTTRFVFAQHSDTECNNLGPNSPVPTLGLIHPPWEHRFRDDRVARRRYPEAEGLVERVLCSELVEQDVVLGNPTKLDELLARGLETAERLGSSLFFSNTCTPIVTGEDVDSVLRRCQQSSSRTVHYLTCTPRSMQTVFDDILVTRRLAAEEATRAPDPEGSINLVGFFGSRDLGDIDAMLAGAGVAVNTHLIPQLEPAAIDRLPRAVLNVVLPVEPWQHFTERLSERSRTPAIAPGGPFGVEGTRRWLGAVLDALGRVDELSAAWEPVLSAHAERIDAAREAASRHRLGLVVRADEVFYLTQPRTTWGIPIVALLEELGFGLDVLLMLRDRGEARQTASAVRDLFRIPERHSVKGFNSPEMLAERLAASPCEAVLTNHAFDWRVTQRGKGVFALQHFEKGVPGAIRTAERLVGICRTPFYSRYARHLRRAADGTREGTRERARPSGPERGDP